MKKTIDQEMYIDFKVILAHTVVDKITVMIQSIDAFLAVPAVVVPWGLCLQTDTALDYRLGIILWS